jgi:hypothetical protein
MTIPQPFSARILVCERGKTTIATISEELQILDFKIDALSTPDLILLHFDTVRVTLTDTVAFARLEAAQNDLKALFVNAAFNDGRGARFAADTLLQHINPPSIRCLATRTHSIRQEVLCLAKRDLTRRHKISVGEAESNISFRTLREKYEDKIKDFGRPDSEITPKQYALHISISAKPYASAPVAESALSKGAGRKRHMHHPPAFK